MSSSEGVRGVRRVDRVRATIQTDAPAARVIAGLRLLGYVRRSQDSGTGVSEEIQRHKIEQWAALYEHEVTFLLPDLDESSWTLDRPGLKKALDLLAKGEYEGIVVAFQDRLTRRTRDFCDLLERAEKQGWHVFAVDTNLDTTKDSTLHKVLAVFAEREYRDKRERFDDARKNAVLVHGVHGGDVAPVGYDWTVRGHDKKGQPQRGPLTPNGDAERVRRAFEAKAGGASWSEVARILGAKSKGATAKVISNRVYLGEARSGDYVKPDAHPALVPEQVFRRANRRKPQALTTRDSGSDWALLSKVLRCGTCLHTLTPDDSLARAGYRCKNVCCPKPKVFVPADAIHPVVLYEAFKAHAARTAYHVADIDAIGIGVFEEKLAQAEAQRAEVEALFEAGELLPVAYGKALSAAEAAVSEAQSALSAAEASQGWLALPPAAVSRRILSAEDGKLVGDVEDARDFIRQTVRVIVKAVGRGRRVPVTERISVEVLTPQAGIVLREVPVPAGQAGDLAYVAVEAETVAERVPV